MPEAWSRRKSIGDAAPEASVALISLPTVIGQGYRKAAPASTRPFLRAHTLDTVETPWTTSSIANTTPKTPPPRDPATGSRRAGSGARPRENGGRRRPSGRSEPAVNQTVRQTLFMLMTSMAISEEGSLRAEAEAAFRDAAPRLLAIAAVIVGNSADAEDV